MSVWHGIVDAMEHKLTYRHEERRYLWEDRTFRSFGVTPCNRDILQTAMAVARDPGGTINPLVICGECGTGKTHLMNAIGVDLCRREWTGVRWLSLDSFQSNIMQQFLNGKNPRCLLVDGLDAFEWLLEAGRKGFLDLLEGIMAGGGQLVMTATNLPPALGETLSRWQGYRVVTLALSDGELRSKLARRWLKKRKLTANDEMVSFLVESFTGGVRGLEGAIIRLAAWSELKKEKPTLAIAKRLLHPSLGKQVKEQE